MVEWISLIIDSHAMQFIMSHEARQLILKIHRLTGQQVCHTHPLVCHHHGVYITLQLRMLESLMKLQGPLELLQSKHTTDTHHKHLYTIEWINFND